MGRLMSDLILENLKYFAQMQQGEIWTERHWRLAFETMLEYEKIAPKEQTICQKTGSHTYSFGSTKCVFCDNHLSIY